MVNLINSQWYKRGQRGLTVHGTWFSCVLFQALLRQFCLISSPEAQASLTLVKSSLQAIVGTCFLNNMTVVFKLDTSYTARPGSISSVRGEHARIRFECVIEDRSFYTLVCFGLHMCYPLLCTVGRHHESQSPTLHSQLNLVLRIASFSIRSKVQRGTVQSQT